VNPANIFISKLRMKLTGLRRIVRSALCVRVENPNLTAMKVPRKVFLLGQNLTYQRKMTKMKLNTWKKLDHSRDKYRQYFCQRNLHGTQKTFFEKCGKRNKKDYT